MGPGRYCGQMTPTQTRFRFRPLTGVLVVVGVAFVALAVVYFTTNAASLPSFLPGHTAGLLRHHTKHGVVMLGLAVLSWIGAWFSTSVK
jgi:hypothetical protein